MVEAFAISDAGLVRTTNEDSYVCDNESHLYVVADGMGGHSAGEVASRLAVEAIAGFIAGSTEEGEFSWPYGIDPLLSHDGNRLRTAVYLANRRVYRSSESHDDYAGMGTTVTAALVSRERLSFAHVGDSRLYQFTGGSLVQVTHDDSWVATVLSSEPSLSQSDLAHHPMRHVLTNVVGARDQIEIQVGELPVSPGMVFLLCSDGLHGMAEDGAIAAILSREGPLEEMGRALVEAAVAGGGHDNVTAVLVRIPA